MKADDLVIPDWSAPARVRACVTTRWSPGRSQPPFDACNLGARCGDSAAAVAANRAALAGWLRLPTPPLWLRQVHGTDVFDADARGLDEEPVADAAVTRTAGRVLAVLTADCLPIVLCTDDGAAVGIVHAGWRGLAAGVVEAAVARLSAPTGSVLAWLGPAIAPSSYEVGDEVRAAFADGDPGAEAAFTPTRPGHWTCDLYALARRRFAAIGVRHIAGGGFDTFADPRFYSYRRDGRTGRFATLVWREAGH